MLSEALAEASPDLVRSMQPRIINELFSADDGAVAGAEYGRPSLERTDQHNGQYRRNLDAGVGTFTVAVPKPRPGNY